jgi:adenylate cyclase
MPQNTERTILFADLCGSTELYDQLGDARARAIVGRCVAAMTNATQHHGGTVVKTIGDEVMAMFVTPNAAAEAACEMQEIISGMVVDGRPLAIHIGFHCGSPLIDDTDVFGDTVNLAARMANQAKSSQIVTTSATVAQLSGKSRDMCRQVDLTEVQGKHGQIAIYELVWAPEGATVIRAPWATPRRASDRFAFTAGGSRLELGESDPVLTIGRAEENDLVVRNPVVSRLHARIEHRNGRVVLIDQSANGTYVFADGGEQTYVHRDNHVLTGSGTLGLGEAVSSASELLVRYEPAQ